MKKIFKYSLILMAFAAMVVGCQIPEAVEPQYVPGEADNSFCYGVSFPKQDAAGSHSFDPEADKVITLTAKRINTFGDVTVPVEVVDTAGVFVVAPIVFADGQEETTFDVTFPTAKNGIKYGATINVTDTEYASIYGQGAVSVSFDVLIVTWIDFLNPVTKEPAVFTISHPWSGSRGEGHATMKYYEVGGVRTCIFTSVDKDTDGNPVGIWHGDPIANFSARWYVEDLPSATDASKILSHTNSEGNDFVEFVTQYIGFDYNDGDWQATATPAAPINGYDWFWYWNMRGYSIDDLYGSWLDDANIEGSPDEGYPLGYYDGNGGFFFQLYYFIPGVGGWKPSGYNTIALADGFDRTDYSIALDTDFSSEGKTPVFVETGKDVASIKYAVYPGELTSTQAANKAPLIADGTDESVTFSELVLDEEEGIKYATLELAPETSGLYTVVAVSFAEDGKEAKDAAYVVINHIAAADIEAYAVDVQVGVEDVPARYTEFNNISAFGYYVLGKGLTEVHVAVVETAKYEKDVDSYNDSVKETASLALSESALAQANATGGYFTLTTGLSPLTSYTVIVWATNGDMEKIVTAERTTDGLPLVPVAVGNYKYTVAFSSWGTDTGINLVFDPNSDQYILQNIFYYVNFYFSMDDAGVIHFDPQDTGATYSGTPIYVLESYDYFDDDVIADPNNGITEEEAADIKKNSFYDSENKVYYFNMAFVVPNVGSFGHGWETFTVTGDPAAGAPAKAFAKPTSLPSLYTAVKGGWVPSGKVEVYERDAKSVKVSATVSYERKANRGESLIAKKGPSVK
ncbi:MAG: hypothetical protein IKR38_05000 [Bacteroidales bacterium]|nr:hypothetical protein [Bacteroidales bacterium]